MFPFIWSWLEIIKAVVAFFAFFDRDEVVDRSKCVHKLLLRIFIELWRMIVDSPSSSEDLIGTVYHTHEGAMLTIEQLVFDLSFYWTVVGLASSSKKQL
jgi:hypothetical protein